MEVNNYMDIIDVLDEAVQTLARIKWSNDDCPPEFIVSVDNEDLANQSILLSIKHGGSKFTQKLFPRTDTEYGYPSLMELMTNMYNRTM